MIEEAKKMLYEDWSASILLAKRLQIAQILRVHSNLTEAKRFFRALALIASKMLALQSLIIIVGDNRIGKQGFDGFGAPVADEI
jgi:hypothetical protein